MEAPTPFLEQVRDAYEHLYDLVYLRTHPLAESLVADPTLSRKDRAWRLHQMLLEAVDELNPGLETPVFSREWRRYRLMVLRYLDGLDVHAVSSQVAIGRRQYYRDHERAIEAVARVLWDRRAERGNDPEADVGAASQPSLTRVEMLRIEVARAARTGHYTILPEIVASLERILRDRLSERNIEICVEMPDLLPRLVTDSSLLRQMLLGLAGYFVERAERAHVRISARLDAPTAVQLTVGVEPPSAVHRTHPDEPLRFLIALSELASVGGVQVEPQVAHTLIGVTLQLPTSPPNVILVVDDNEDTLELLRRYLTVHNYVVVSSASAVDAFELAQGLHPQAITLDLMMPDCDGWDLMRMLLAHPETRTIPIIVVSVLRQKELALSLGATAFLEKPFNEQRLLAMLQEIGGG